MDAAEHKHVVLGLIFLEYISDAFEEHHAKLVADQVDPVITGQRRPELPAPISPASFDGG
jgi:hypothetical protein